MAMHPSMAADPQVDLFVSVRKRRSVRLSTGAGAPLLMNVEEALDLANNIVDVAEALSLAETDDNTQKED